MRIIAHALTAVALTCAATASVALPPPPPPPEMENLAKALVAAFNNRDGAALRQLLHDDVAVFEEGLQICASASKCTAQFDSKFLTFGRRFNVKAGYVDRYRIILIQGQDCCDYNHITEFRARGGKVVEIRRLADVGLPIDQYGNRVDLKLDKRESF